MTRRLTVFLTVMVGCLLAPAIAQASVSPSSINFGALTSDTIVTVTVTDGSTEDWDIGVEATNTPAFSVVDSTCSYLYAQTPWDSSCSLHVQFNAGSLPLGSYSDVLDIPYCGYTSCSDYLVPLSGTVGTVTGGGTGGGTGGTGGGTGGTGGGTSGGPSVTLSPTSSDFGTVGGTTLYKGFNFTNNSTGTISIQSVTIGQSPIFSLGSDACPGLNLQASWSCGFNVAANAVKSGSYVLPAGTYSDTVTVSYANGYTRTATVTATIPPLTGGTVTPNPGSFGSVAQATTKNFTFTNGGTVSDTVSSVTATGSGFSLKSDGCSGKIIAAAGGSCLVSVTFDPSTVPLGGASGSFSVHFTGQGSTQQYLTGPSLSATAVAPSYSATLTSSNGGSYGSLAEAASQNFTYTNTSNVDVIVTSARVGGQPFSISSDSCTGVRLPPTRTCSVSATFDPATVAAGDYADTLTVNSRDVGNTQSFPDTQALTGTAIAPILQATLAPATWNYGTVATLSSHTFTLTNTSNVHILTGQTSVSEPYEKISSSCPASLAPSASCTITIRFDPTAVAAGAYSEQIIQHSTDMAGASLIDTSVGITGTSPDVAVISLSPLPSLSFGTVYAPTTRVVTVTETNGGANSASPVTGISLVNGSPFAVSSDACSGTTIPPLGSCQISVTFNPTAPGTYTDTLTISHDGTQSSLPISAAMLPPTATPSVCCKSVNHTTFYPLLRDGYRDTLTYDFTAGYTNILGDVTAGPVVKVLILNRYNAIVRSWTIDQGQTALTPRAITWNGRNRFSKLVKPGTYWFETTVSGFGQSARTSLLAVMVRSG